MQLHPINCQQFILDEEDHSDHTVIWLEVIVFWLVNVYIWHTMPLKWTRTFSLSNNNNDWLSPIIYYNYLHTIVTDYWMLLLLWVSQFLLWNGWCPEQSPLCWTSQLRSTFCQIIALKTEIGGECSLLVRLAGGMVLTHHLSCVPLLWE